ncbi:MAG: DUF1570 domain-containing protein [Planctomycetaceae bacterium]
MRLLAPPFVFACLVPAACLCFFSNLALAAGPPFVELTVDGAAQQGKVVARDSRSAWLMERDGRLSFIELGKVTEFRKLAGDFRPLATNHLRDRLQKEFGRDFETAATRQYVVCAPKGAARAYAELFEETYDTFRMYFGVRGFEVSKPEFPLVAVVFPNREAFLDYCREEGLAATNFVGVYMARSNRVALYDPRGKGTSSLGDESASRLARRDAGSLDQAFGAIDAGLHDTIVHEATHQVAYNTGLHSRTGANPRWVVEGLATVFEAPGIRDSSKNRSADSRINRGRFVEFRGFMPRRQAKSLAEFVSNDDAYQATPSEAYAEGWALTFYLIETRPREYAGYLKKIAARDPHAAYPADERLADFKTAFGNHIEILEADFLRFMERLKS